MGGVDWSWYKVSFISCFISYFIWICCSTFHLFLLHLDSFFFFSVLLSVFLSVLLSVSQFFFLSNNPVICQAYFASRLTNLLSFYPCYDPILLQLETYFTSAIRFISYLLSNCLSTKLFYSFILPFTVTTGYVIICILFIFSWTISRILCIVFFVMWNGIAWYFTVLYCTALYCNVLYCNVLYCIVTYYIT